MLRYFLLLPRLYNERCNFIHSYYFLEFHLNVRMHLGMKTNKLTKKLEPKLWLIIFPDETLASTLKTEY